MGLCAVAWIAAWTCTWTAQAVRTPYVDVREGVHPHLGKEPRCKWEKSCRPLRKFQHVKSVEGKLDVHLELKATCLKLVEENKECLPTRVLALAQSVGGVPEGVVSPLLRVNPGDVIRIKLTNRLDDTPPGQGTPALRKGHMPENAMEASAAVGGLPNGWSHPRHGDNPYYPMPFETGEAPDVPCCANLTNLHPHGLHVSPQEDDVLSSRIGPGDTQTMTYHVHPQQAPGTHWYHPHSHGSVSLQASGGAAGALIVEDDPKEMAKCCPELSAMAEEVLLISGFRMTPKTPPKPWDSLGCPPGSRFVGNGANFGTLSWQAGDNLYAGAFNATGSGVFPCPEGVEGCRSDYRALARLFGADRITRKAVCEEGLLENLLVNGQLQPVVAQRPGEFRRWRLINGSPSSVVFLKFPSSCKIWLVSLDGVYLMASKAAQLKERSIHLEPGARADVAVSCNQQGTFPVIAEKGPMPKAGKITYFEGVLMFMQIRGTPFSPAMLPPLHLPKLTQGPEVTYLSDISDEEPTAHFRLTLNSTKLNVRDPDTNLGVRRQKLAWSFVEGKRPSASVLEVNKQLYANSTDFLREVSLNGMEEWEICSNSYHPFHIHTSPFLLVDYPSRFTDWPMPTWRDTVMTIPNQCFRARFPFRDYDGILVLHCHIL